MLMAKKELITGEKAEISGLYVYNGPISKKPSCSPTQEERIIPLDAGDTAPPVKSCGDSAKWKLVKTT